MCSTAVEQSLQDHHLSELQGSPSYELAVKAVTYGYVLRHSQVSLCSVPPPGITPAFQISSDPVDPGQGVVQQGIPVFAA